MATQQRITHVLLDREYLRIIDRSEVDRHVALAVERRQALADELQMVSIIDDAPIAGWSTVDEDTISTHEAAGYRVTAISRTIWLRHVVDGTVIGAERSRRIWMAYAEGFSVDPSVSEVSLGAAIGNLARRIRRSSR